MKQLLFAMSLAFAMSLPLFSTQYNASTDIITYYGDWVNDSEYHEINVSGAGLIELKITVDLSCANDGYDDIYSGIDIIDGNGDYYDASGYLDWVNCSQEHHEYIYYLENDIQLYFYTYSTYSASSVVKVEYSDVRYHVTYEYDAAGLRLIRKMQTITTSSSKMEGDEEEKGIEEDWKEQHVKIFPNPTNSDLFVEIQDIDSEKDYDYLLYDATGRGIAHGRIVRYGTTRVGMEGFPPGIYYLSIRSHGEALTYKVIKR